MGAPLQSGAAAAQQPEAQSDSTSTMPRATKRLSLQGGIATLREVGKTAIPSISLPATT